MAKWLSAPLVALAVSNTVVATRRQAQKRVRSGPLGQVQPSFSSLSAPKNSVNFEEIKVAVLGKKYDLSVAFLSPGEMQKITRERLPKKTKKDPGHISNVLSFPLSPTSGEILLCPKVAEKECVHYGMNKSTYLAYLFIHGCFHLKGLAHGATMESEEKRIMRRFGLRSSE